MELAIKKTAWQNATQLQKQVFRLVFERVQLGYPAIYLDESLNEWYTFRDTRMKLNGIAAIGCMAANLADWPTNYELPATWEETRSKLKTWLQNPARTHPLVLPSEITYPDDVNVVQYTLDMNNAPNAIRGEISETWVPSGSVE